MLFNPMWSWRASDIALNGNHDESAKPRVNALSGLPQSRCCRKKRNWLSTICGTGYLRLGRIPALEEIPDVIQLKMSFGSVKRAIDYC